MDNLEKFIGTNRPDFDAEIPTEKVWINLEKHLNKKQPRRILFGALAMKIAAAVALLILGTGIGISIQKKYGGNSAEDMGTPLATNLKEAEKFYDTRIKSDMIQLAAFKTDSTVYFDLRQIDAVQEELRQELQQAPLSSQTDIIQKMIQNYQIKADILERVLKQMGKNPDHFIKQDINKNESI